MRTDVTIRTKFKPFKVKVEEGAYHTLQPGDLIWYQDTETVRQFARVYGTVWTQTWPQQKTADICVIVMSDGLVFERWIRKEQIRKIIRPSPELLRTMVWFYSAQFLNTPEELARDCFEKVSTQLLASIGG